MASAATGFRFPKYFFVCAATHRIAAFSLLVLQGSFIGRRTRTLLSVAKTMHRSY
jgi:hypothetical protein